MPAPSSPSNDQPMMNGTGTSAASIHPPSATTAVSPSPAIASTPNATAPLPATAPSPNLSPAALARAKKLAQGGSMDFVERPGAVYISSRNLAPPPPKPTPTAPDSSASAAPPSFSLITWLCTSRSRWAWLVRGLLVACTIAGTAVAVQAYRAWREEMNVRMERWKERERRRKEEEERKKSIESQVASSSDDGSAVFQQLMALVTSRYRQLHRYGSVLKRLPASDGPDRTGAQDMANGATDDRDDENRNAELLTPQQATARMSFVFDEFERVLHENTYLRDLLKRLHAQIKQR